MNELIEKWCAILFSKIENPNFDHFLQVKKLENLLKQKLIKGK